MGTCARPSAAPAVSKDRLGDVLAHAQVNLVSGMRAVRIERGLSISQVAATMGVDPAQVSRFESGSTNPTMATIRRYAEAVGAVFRIETGPWTDPDESSSPCGEPTVPVSRYPQLRFICWQLAPDAELTEPEALSRYEREWRHVDTAALTAEEKAFIDHLAQTYAGGKLLV